MNFEIGDRVSGWTCVSEIRIYGVVTEIRNFDVGTCVTIKTDNGSLKDFWAYQLTKE